MAICDACEQGIELYKGRDRTIRVTLTTSNGTALDLTGASVWFSAKDEKSDPDDEAIILKRNAAAGGSDSEILITDATGGVIEVYIEDTDTAAVDPAYYWYDMVVETSAGKKLEVIPPSRFQLLQPITVT